MIDRNNCFTYAYNDGSFTDYLQNINGDEALTNVINLDTSGVSMVGHKGPYLIAYSIAAGSGTGDIEIRLVSSTSTTMSGATTVNVWKFADTVMTAGALLINQQLPVGLYNQYLGLYFDSTTTTCSQFLAYLSDTPEPAAALVANTAS